MVYARGLLCAILLLCGSLSAAEKTDPRVEEILDAWQRKADGMGSYCVKGRRFVYDSVFEVEKRSKFEMA